MIVIRDLCKTFGGVQAVRRLNLVVPRGELFCFLGPNGAGKTTTIKIITGLLRPTSGSVSVCGHDVQREPLLAKRRMGYIPDMPFLYDRLTASEFFEFTGELYGISTARIRNARKELFNLFGLQELQSALTRDLSHGMRQRLLYACTFLHEPQVLLIDEPLIGLDPYTIRLIKDLLRRKVSEGMTVFLTTHILSLAEDIADRIGLILEGRLAGLGTLAELRTLVPEAKTLEEVFLQVTRLSGKGASGHASG